MTITEKVAYLKGLIEGMEIDEATKEGKILKAIMDVLSDVALSVEDLEATVQEMGEQVDTIDEDLDALETDYYDEYDEYDDDDCDCGCCDDEFYDVTCPNCNEEFAVDEDTLLDGGVDCPLCGKHLEFDIEECDDDCDCCCDDCEE
ncbi:MAG: hypothetical protein J6K62_04690 [Clostridia bacterium]|nr:hypothetical protein [Clostridia bacterium]